MKIELLRSLLDKGTINDNTLMLIKIPCGDGGKDHILNISGVSIEHEIIGDDTVLIFNGELGPHEHE